MLKLNTLVQVRDKRDRVVFHTGILREFGMVPVKNSTGEIIMTGVALVEGLDAWVPMACVEPV